MIDSEGYRSNVGIVLLNRNNEVLNDRAPNFFLLIVLYVRRS